jgi:hypothetical protein
LKRIPPHLQWTASTLLSPEQIFRLNGGAIALVPEGTLDKVLGNFPTNVRKVLQTEARIRAMLTRQDLDYEALERIAILAGVPPILPGDRRVPKTRWSVHPEGYLTRYLPKAASRTVVQVWVPRQVRLNLDQSGRIESLHDNSGNQLNFEYEDGIHSVPSVSDPDLNVIRLESVRWSRFDRANRVTESATFAKDSGWTFNRQQIGGTNKNARKMKTSAGKWESLYQAARTREAKVKDFLTRTSRTSVRASSPLRPLLNTVHLRETLRSALGHGDPAVQTGFELLSHSLAAGIGHHLLESVQVSPTRTVEFDPASQVAVPANTGRQRLGLSARLY